MKAKEALKRTKEAIDLRKKEFYSKCETDMSHIYNKIKEFSGNGSNYIVLDISYVRTIDDWTILLRKGFLKSDIVYTFEHVKNILTPLGYSIEIDKFNERVLISWKK